MACQIANCLVLKVQFTLADSAIAMNLTLLHITFVYGYLPWRYNYSLLESKSTILLLSCSLTLFKLNIY